MPWLSEPYLHALGDAARFMRDAWARQAISPADMREAIRATVLDQVHAGSWIADMNSNRPRDDRAVS
jgi:hypothetical protein